MATYTTNKEIKNTNGVVIANMVGTFNGEGDTPVIMTMGTGAPVGYNDDGTAILMQEDDEAVAAAQQQFMEELIARNKLLSKLNGYDETKVNGAVEL